MHANKAVTNALKQADSMYLEIYLDGTKTWLGAAVKIVKLSSRTLKNFKRVRTSPLLRSAGDPLLMFVARCAAFEDLDPGIGDVAVLRAEMEQMNL